MSTDPNTLPLWLSIPVTLLLVLVPGFVTHSLILTFGADKPGRKNFSGSALNLTERIFWTIALSVAITGWTAFVLAEIGLYSIELLSVVLIIYCVVAGLVFKRRISNSFSQKDRQLSKPLFSISKFRINRENINGIALALLLMATVGLFFWRTHETVVGEQDSGTYYDTGINIAQTGSILIHDPLLPAFNAAGPFSPTIEGKLQSQLLKGMPGEVNRYLFVSHQRLSAYFVNDNERGLQTGEVVPQFFHFYPALIAIAYSLFGFFGGLYITPFLGVLAVFAVYLTARRLFPAPSQSWIAWLGAAILALNPVEVWFVRETLWETLGQFLVFTGIYAISLYAKPYPLADGENETTQHRDSGAARLGAFGAGVSFGLVTLAHSQFPFIIAPLFPLLVYLRLSRRWSREVWWLALPFGLLLLHTTIHIRAFALGYFEGIYHHILVFFGDTIVYWTALATLLIVALIVIDAMPQRILAIEKWVLARWQWISVGVAVIVVGYLLYSYFIRVYQIKLDWHESEPTHYFSLQSYIGAPTTAGKERNLLRLGWYLSPLGILMVFIGAGALCWKRLNLRSAMFLSVTAILSLLFLDQNYTLEHFIYSMRRYMPVTFPAFSIIIAYALLGVLPAIGSWIYVRLNRFTSLRRRQVVTTATNSGASAAIHLPGVAFSVAQETQIKEPNHAVTALQTNDQNAQSNWGYTVGRWGGWLGALALAVFFVFTGMTIYRLQQYDGVTHQLENLAQNFGPRDIIIFSGDPASDGKIAVPLNYVFDRQSFVLSRAPKNDLLGQLFSYWQKQGYHIKAMLGNNGGRLSADGFDMVQTGNFKLTLTQLQDSDKQKPKNIETNSLDYGIFDVQPHNGAIGTVGFGQGSVTQANGWNLRTGTNDFAALIDGFYPLEQDTSGNSVYRWTDGDPLHHPILRLPCLAPNAKNSLSVVLSPGLNPNPISIKVYLSNQWYDDPTDPKSPLKQAAGTIQLTPGTGPKTYTIQVPSNLPQTDCANGSIILHLVMDNKAGFVPLNLNTGINDARLLGYKFYSVGLASKP